MYRGAARTYWARARRAGLPGPGGADYTAERSTRHGHGPQPTRFSMQFYLSQVVGRPVRDPQGESIGKVADLIVAIGDRYPPVTGLVVLTDRRRIFLPWSDVASFDINGATLNTDRIDITKFRQRPNELLLNLDLQDKQIVDLDGRKVVRVNDLRLDELEGIVAPRGGGRGRGRAAATAGGRGPLPHHRPQPAPAPPRALHRLGGRGPRRNVHRLHPAARAARRPARAAPGRPGLDHRPAGAARPGRRAGQPGRRGGRRRDRGDGARHPGRGPGGPPARRGPRTSSRR